MDFKSFIQTIVGLVFIGVSIGYVLGFYVSKYSMNNYFFYLSVLFMAIGCSVVIYGTLFSKKEK